MFIFLIAEGPSVMMEELVISKNSLHCKLLTSFYFKSFKLCKIELCLADPVPSAVLYRPPKYGIAMDYDRILIVGDFNVRVWYPKDF